MTNKWLWRICGVLFWGGLLTLLTYLNCVKPLNDLVEKARQI